jgi:hypothetical protein
MKKLLLTTLLLGTTLFGNIAQITALSGEATITRDTQTLTPVIGSLLEEKDKLATGEDGRLQIVFEDKTVISLGKNSSFDIEEYLFDTQKPEDTKATFGMTKGVLKAITGQVGKINPSKFTLKTKSASIGIRGTNFFVEILPNGDILVAATEGSVVVITPFGEVVLTQGQFTMVRPNEAPTPAQEITPTQLEQLEQNSGAKENEQESGYDDGVLFISAQEEQNTQNPEITDEQSNDSQELAQSVLDDQASQTATDTITQSSQSLFSIAVEASGVNVNDFTTIEREFITNDYITSELGSGWIANIKDTTITVPSVSLSLNGTGNDDGFDWGFWGTGSTAADPLNPTKVWIVGQNLVSDISSLSGTASYSGKVMGVTNTGDLIDPSNSTINITFNFGANTADVSFPQINGSTGFGGITSGTYSTSGSTYTIQGTIDNKLEGSFYDNLNMTAGNFSIDSNKGVYKAKKQ